MASPEDFKKLNDQELLAKYRDSGNNTYLGHLFERYTHLVMGVCMKYLRDEDESKDMVMQIFEKILLEIGKHEIHFFRGWLHTLSRNECLMKLRKTKHEFSRQDENYVENQAALHLQNGVDESAETHEQKLQGLEAAIQKLETHQRTCVELFYLQSFSYQQVADKTGFTLLQVKSYIQNGKRNLKNMMTKNE